MFSFNSKTRLFAALVPIVLGAFFIALLFVVLAPGQAQALAVSLAPPAADQQTASLLPLQVPVKLTSSFAAKRFFGTGKDNTQSVAVGDMNGDGFLDLVVGNWYEPNVVYLNDGAGNFYSGVVDCAAPPSNVRCFSTGTNNVSYSVAVGDMNGDGALDIVVGNNGQQNVVYLNDGTGNFTTAHNFGTGTDATNSVAVGDLNGDGFLDLIVGNGYVYSSACNCYTGTQNVVYLNNGMGDFTTALNFGTGADSTTSVVVGDMNGDGRLDIVVGNMGYSQTCGCYTGEQNVVYLNDGAAVPNFTASRNFGTGTDKTQSVAVGDMNRDGSLDLVVGNYFEQNVVYLNDGAGNFTTAHIFGTGPDATDSVAVSDVNGDGFLDLVVGNYNQQNVVYLNDGAGNFYSGVVNCSAPPGTVSCFGSGTDWTASVTVGDMNGDGFLDLVLGNNGQPNVVYLNDGAGSFTTTRNFGTGTDKTQSVAVGDMNRDGSLDLVVGNYGEQNVVYLNNGAGNFYSGAVNCAAPPGNARCFGTSTNTESVAVGDMNGDSFLDIVVGNYNQPNVVYLNDGAGNFYSGAVNCAAPPGNVRCFGTGTDATSSVAVGDMNGDGFLDLVVGNQNQPNVVYLNDGAGNFSTTRIFGTGTDRTQSVAIGDMNGDGFLDLVVGNINQPNVVYLNDGAGNFPPNSARTFGTGTNTESAAVGDLNGDGFLDLVVGNYVQPNIIYLNDGAGNFSTTRIFGTGTDATLSVAVGDLNGDGFLDLVVGNYNQPDIVYLNDGAGNFLPGSARTFGMGTEWTQSVAVGDLNGDGFLDLVVGNTGASVGQQNVAYLNDIGSVKLLNNPPRVTVTRPIATANANFFSTPIIKGTTAIPITYTLADSESDPVRAIRAYYSPDGGGKWYMAAASGTLTTNLNTTITGTPHVFNWDVFNSGFFGESDNVVFRIEAYPSLLSGARSVPIFQRPYAAATTFPFRVRGTQVRVVSNTVPVSNAIVYRLPAGQSVDALPMADASRKPFRTDGQGYLQGRGELELGDRLVALLPITSTGTYTLYYTSAAPTLSGLAAYTVTQAGVQTLTVSAAKPLILFDLNVSLEWDARQDTTTLNQLKFDLQRASELLYDWTDGQAALGHVNLYQAGDHWNDANVRLLANNRLRPNAGQGGVVSSAITETLASAQVITYEPSQVRMAVDWNRNGDPGSVIGDDWARAFAHELGHYLFFLDDNYLGTDANGQFMAVPTCPSVMSDPYSGDKLTGYDEFKIQAIWLPGCVNTLANRETGRSDWRTIERFYPALNEIVTDTLPAHRGPSNLPLAVTQIEVQPVASAALALPLASPVYSLLKAEGGSYAPQRASAYLFQGIRADGHSSDRLVELGSPVSGKVEARGARVDDRLCVFDPDAKRLGCATLNNIGRTLPLTNMPAWNPEVIITPVTSRTIQLEMKGITLTSTEVMKAQLFPHDVVTASSVITMQQVGTTNTYSGTFTLPAEALEASVYAWVEGGAQRELVSNYSIGGNPAPRRPGARNHPPRRGRRAPVLSSDGQAQVLGIQATFPTGQFYALQNVNNFPAPPSWTTVVGQAYRLIRSAGAPTITGSSLVINYLPGEVPPGEAPFLKIYFYPKNGAGWQALPTALDATADLASGPIQSVDGLYLLLSSIDVPLTPGWNNIAYPVGARPVTEALASIAGKYSQVCGYVPDDVANPWHCFGPSAPGWVNDLTELKFGSYWTYLTTTQAVTLSLKGPFGAAAQQPDQATGLELPPAIYYGQVLSGANFVPAAGMTITATIAGQSCGQALLQDIDGLPMYAIDVRAADVSGSSACGRPGANDVVSFYVGDQLLSPTKLWDHTQLWLQDLGVGPSGGNVKIYLPLIRR